MAKAYDFRKVYADLVGPDGTVAVLYLNEVHLAGVRTTRASVELYDPEGNRSLYHGIAEVAPLEPDSVLGRLEVPLADGTVRMEVEVEHEPWRPTEPFPAHPLSWEVLASRTHARLHWPGGGLFEGTGYVDWVEITIPTRLLQLRHLWWCRAHLPDRTVIVEWLERAGAPGWHVAAEVGGHRRVEHTPDPFVLDDSGHVVVDLDGTEIQLAPHRVLHDGPAFDPDRVPRWLDRKACEIVGGPTRETRWQGTATFRDQTGPALWEHVRFGPAAG